jgi:hypothetical protein
MLSLYDEKSVLIDYPQASQILKFYSTDSDNLYRKNKKLLGTEWMYHSSEIEYKFNSLGYRTKEISEISGDFLLTFGCSYTEGVGLHQNQIWNNAVSSYLNLDLYNHAKQATGIDIQCFNALLWNISNFPKPKLVIVQWPHKHRKSFGDRDKDSINVSDKSYTPTLDGKWWSNRYIQNTGEMELNILLWIESFNNLWKQLNVPVLNFTWDSDLLPCVQRSKYKIYKIKPNNFDKARDLEHDGPLFHADTFEKIKHLLSLPNFTDKI